MLSKILLNNYNYLSKLDNNFTRDPGYTFCVRSIYCHLLKQFLCWLYDK